MFSLCYIIIIVLHNIHIVFLTPFIFYLRTDILYYYHHRFLGNHTTNAAAHQCAGGRGKNGLLIFVVLPSTVNSTSVCIIYILVCSYLSFAFLPPSLSLHDRSPYDPTTPSAHRYERRVSLRPFSP